MKAAQRQLKDLEKYIKNDIIGKADVICATCIGAGHPLLSDRRFPVVILDGTISFLFLFFVLFSFFFFMFLFLFICFFFFFLFLFLFICFLFFTLIVFIFI